MTWSLWFKVFSMVDTLSLNCLTFLSLSSISIVSLSSSFYGHFTFSEIFSVFLSSTSRRISLALLSFLSIYISSFSLFTSWTLHWFITFRDSFSVFKLSTSSRLPVISTTTRRYGRYMFLILAPAEGFRPRLFPLGSNKRLLLMKTADADEELSQWWLLFSLERETHSDVCTD